MNLSQFDMVERHVVERRALQRKLDVLAVPMSEWPLGTVLFGVSIEGSRQGADIVELLRPVVVRELKAQITQIDRDLEELGVNTSS